MKIPEPLRKMATAARRQNWVITYTGSGHLRWQPPSGMAIYTPSTPGGDRSIANCLARLRRAGLRLKTP